MLTDRQTDKKTKGKYNLLGGGNDTDSDHNLLTVRMKVRHNRRIKTAPTELFNLEELKDDKAVQYAFNCTLRADMH